MDASEPISREGVLRHGEGGETESVEHPAGTEGSQVVREREAPDSPRLFHNLACALSRAGRRGEAPAAAAVQIRSRPCAVSSGGSRGAAGVVEKGGGLQINYKDFFAGEKTSILVTARRQD